MILGIDPGLDGAFALLGEALAVRQMPTVLRAVSGKPKPRRFIDRTACVELLKGFRLLGAETFVVERVMGVEGQSVHGAFMFGHGAGGITYAAEALGYRVEEVPPATWKTALRVPSDKKLAVARADALLPAWVNLWTGGSLPARSGRAEAALIALYGQQVFGSEA